MIPAFNDDGYLPPGIHSATLDEVEARFGQESEVRRVQMQSLRWLVELARRAGVQRIVVDGSFVTDKSESNDVDCAILTGPKFPLDTTAETELRIGLPFIGLVLVGPKAFRHYTATIFATDRDLVPKGMLEIEYDH